MENYGENIMTPGVFGGVGEAPIDNASLPAKQGFWSKFKAICFQEVDLKKEVLKVELTPAQQKVEDEINGFLNQEVTFEKIHNFLFQEVKLK